jgi:hypothetical protein
MVPPQRRLPLRRPIAVAALAPCWWRRWAPVLPTPLKEGVNWLRRYPDWLQRAALWPEPPPFGGLAASQVGFASFQVVSTSGEVAFEGGL